MGDREREEEARKRGEGDKKGQIHTDKVFRIQYKKKVFKKNYQNINILIFLS